MHFDLKPKTNEMSPMLKKILFTALALFALSTVAPSVEAKKESKPNTIEVAPPAEGMAKVVFFRPKKFVGGAVGFIVREGETELGKLRNGNYFMIDVTPGKHAYVVHSEAKDVLNLDLEAGEIAYVAASISMGAFVGRPNLAPSDEAAFRAEAKLKPSKPLKKKD